MTPSSSSTVYLLVSQHDSHRDEVAHFLSSRKLSTEGMEQHPDFLWLEPETSMGIDEIRSLQNWCMEKPYTLAWKVAVILQAETLTIEAQNAILKLLEEPPSYLRIVLVCSNEHRLLPTIRSRCVVIRERRVDTNTSAATSFPATAREALELSEKVPQDRIDAIRYFEKLLQEQQTMLEQQPTGIGAERLSHLVHLLHHLKGNVNVKLAVENFFLASLQPNPA